MRKVIGIGETVLDILFRDEQPIAALPGGSVFNAMVSLGRCGVPAMMISEISDDRLGAYTARFLTENGVDASLVQKNHRTQSPLSLAFLNENNDAEYLFYKDHLHDCLDFGARGENLPDIQPDDILLMGSFYAVNPVIREQVKTLLDKANECGAIIYYDINFRPSHRGDVMRVMPQMMENFELADIVRGSTEDLMTVYGRSDAEAVFRANIAFYCQNLICTDASRPVRLFTREGDGKAYPVASTAQPVSTVGAGDSFNAGFLFALLRHGVTKEMIARGLSLDLWDALIASALQFAAESCRDIYNYVSKEFGLRMQERQLFAE